MFLVKVTRIETIKWISDPDQDPLPVTNENRDEFVRLYLEWLLNNRIAERFRAFYLGFHSVSNFFLFNQEM